MAIKIKNDAVRLNVYISPKIKDRLNEFAKNNYTTLSGALNMILNQWFDGQDAMRSMNNLQDLMKQVAEKTGIDLSNLPKST